MHQHRQWQQQNKSQRTYMNAKCQYTGIGFPVFHTSVVMDVQTENMQIKVNNLFRIAAQLHKSSTAGQTTFHGHTSCLHHLLTHQQYCRFGGMSHQKSACKKSPGIQLSE